MPLQPASAYDACSAPWWRLRRRDRWQQSTFWRSTSALRGHLGEFGIVVAQGPANLTAVAGILADETNELPESVREIGRLYLDQAGLLTDKIDGLMLKLRKATKENEDMRRLCTVPGVGPVTAGAILAFAPDLRAFKGGRNFAAWLSLVPRQHSTGGSELLPVKARPPSGVDLSQRALVVGKE